MRVEDMMQATRYTMDRLGYYAGGPCYDEDMPAYVAPVGTAYGVDNPIWLVVAHYDDYWFCEDSDGNATTIGDTPQQALDEWFAVR